MQPIIELKSGLEGIIKLEVIREDGTLKEAEGLNVPFYNLITDSGLNYIISRANSSYYDYNLNTVSRYCRVGTSSTTPTVSDTTLGSQTGSASPAGTVTNSVQYTTTPYYSNHQQVYTFAVGAVSGNLTEIGFFSDSTGGTMWSRALIKDSGGNPTTLTLLPTEQLKVTYTVRRYIPASQTGSFILNTNGTNSTINYTITPANILNNERGYCNLWGDDPPIFLYETQTLGPITGGPSGTEVNVTGFASPYTSNSFEINSSYTVPTTSGNFATGIGSMLLGNYSRAATGTIYQCSFSPKIMKTSSQTLGISIKLSCGRATQQ